MSSVNKNETAQYDTSTSNLTDDQLAKKAEDALAMEGEMEEVSSIFKFTAWAYLEKIYSSALRSNANFKAI